MNKKGLVVLQMFVFMFFMAFVVVFIGIWLLGFNLIDDTLNQDIDVGGGQNLSNINDKTFGQYNEAFVETADILGIVLILGMVFLMLGNAIVFGRENHRLMMIIDFLILLFIFIFSVYLSGAYETLINSTSLLNVFANDMPKSSKFILNLPLFVGTIGALLMIVAYSGIGRDDQEEVNVLGA